MFDRDEGSYKEIKHSVQMPPPVSQLQDLIGILWLGRTQSNVLFHLVYQTGRGHVGHVSSQMALPELGLLTSRLPKLNQLFSSSTTSPNLIPYQLGPYYPRKEGPHFRGPRRNLQLLPLGFHDSKRLYAKHDFSPPSSLHRLSQVGHLGHGTCVP